MDIAAFRRSILAQRGVDSVSGQRCGAGVQPIKLRHVLHNTYLLQTHQQVCDLLRQGKRVLVHYNGGKGRTGGTDFLRSNEVKHRMQCEKKKVNLIVYASFLLKMRVYVRNPRRRLPD